MSKIGRNDPCSCGSGKKYKKCHGDISTLERHQKISYQLIEEHKAKEHQRNKQQGLGKPIISAEVNGIRFVAIKNRLIHSEKWKTFHDFLFEYIKIAMGRDWGNLELSKPLLKRHPILVWSQHLCDLQRETQASEVGIKTAQMTGAVAAYIQLAYDLYLMDHNADLQQKFIRRLKNVENFYGARYELFVAASMIRAGFDIELEDEDDRSSTHCEFVATHKETQRKFSVEAKCNHSKKNRIIRLLGDALKKMADFDRIVFIELNKADEHNSNDLPSFLLNALKSIRREERRVRNINESPPAYIFITNTPWYYHLDKYSFRCLVMADGFLIDDFKYDTVYSNLREAINSRARHIEMHGLIKSMQTHANVPSTFDGEFPEFAFGKSQPRLLIGQKYLVPEPDGFDRVATLVTATVSESQKLAFCGLSFDQGGSEIFTLPLSELEISIWKSNPDTFFGRIINVNPAIKDILGAYDFLYNSYKNTSKEKLLEFMANAEDISELADLSQEDLASIYSERSAYAMWNMTNQPI